MPVPTTSPQQLKFHLQRLGVADNDKLVVHSRLISFGKIDGGATTVLNALQELVGSQGTIIVPTYTLERGTIYNPHTSPSQGMGPLSEYVRLQPGRIRSLTPMHNHCGIGLNAALLLDSNREVSLGSGSDFDYLHRSDFKLLLLGAKLSQGATFLHHLEALAQVPYRKWIDLDRTCEISGNLETIKCKYFARTSNDTHEDFDAIETILQSKHLLKVVPTHLGASRLIGLADLQHEILSLLSKNPFALVVKT